MTMRLHDILYFFVVVVLFRFLLLNWLTSKTIDLAERLTIVLERWLVKSEVEAVTWLHYKLRAQRQGHKPKTLVQCKDGECVRVK